MIYDPVGLIKDSLKCIAWKGRAIVVGFAAGEIEKVRRSPRFQQVHCQSDADLATLQLPLNIVLLKNISIVGLHWGAYTSQPKEAARVKEVWDKLFE